MFGFKEFSDVEKLDEKNIDEATTPDFSSQEGNNKASLVDEVEYFIRLGENSGTPPPKKEKSLKELGIPVQETVLRAGQGVLVQETLPPFSIYTKKGLRIDVPGIPVSELEEAQSKVDETFKAKELGKRENTVDYVWSVFEKYIRSAPNCPKDISFSKNALRRFFWEYMKLRNDNLDMSGMVRSAIKEGIHFEFYEDFKTSSSSETAVGCYNYQAKSIKFNCKNYVYNEHSCIHNTLAHELCHYSMDDLGKGGYACTFLNSDLGKIWYECMKSESFLGAPEWKKTYKQYRDKNKERLYGDFPFFENLRKEYKILLSYQAGNPQKGEMFARFMGLIAHKKGGLDWLETNDPTRKGLQIVCDMAMAHADEDKSQYKAIVQKLSEHKISKETMLSLLNLKSCQEDIREKGEFSEDDYILLANIRVDAKKSIKKEFECFEEKLPNNEQKGITGHNGVSATTLYDRLAKCSQSLENGRLQLRKKQLEEKNQKQIQPQYPVVPVKPEISILARFKKALAEK